MVTRRTYGAVLAFLGVLAVSPSPVLLRLAQQEQPAPGCAQFYKLVLKTVTLFIVMCIVHNGVTPYMVSSKQMGGHFLAAAGCLGFYYMFENWAILHTSVANEEVFKQLSPCWSALLGILVFAEKPPAVTLVAVLVTIMCACIIFIGSRHVDIDESRPESLAGDISALFSSFFLAAYLTVVNDAARKFPSKNMVGCTSLGCLLASFPFMFEAHWEVGTTCWPVDGVLGWRWTLLSGAVATPFSIALLTLGSKYCSATVVSLFYVMDAALAPLWTWLILDEVPNSCSLVGGTCLLTTLAIHEYVLLDAEDANMEKSVEAERTPLMPEQAREPA